MLCFSSLQRYQSPTCWPFSAEKVPKMHKWLEIQAIAVSIYAFCCLIWCNYFFFSVIWRVLTFILFIWCRSRWLIAAFVWLNLVPPKISRPPLSTRVVEGETAVFDCIVTGTRYPVTVISWTYEETPLDVRINVKFNINCALYIISKWWTPVYQEIFFCWPTIYDLGSLDKHVYIVVRNSDV